MKTHSRFEFICPRCGGSTFGTTGLGEFGSIATATGHCHGGLNEDNGCKFTWPRTEDWRYFGKVTVERCESKQEFENRRDW